MAAPATSFDIDNVTVFDMRKGRFPGRGVNCEDHRLKVTATGAPHCTSLGLLIYWKEGAFRPQERTTPASWDDFSFTTEKSTIGGYEKDQITLRGDLIQFDSSDENRMVPPAPPALCYGALFYALDCSALQWARSQVDMVTPYFFLKKSRASKGFPRALRCCSFAGERKTGVTRPGGSRSRGLAKTGVTRPGGAKIHLRKNSAICILYRF